MNMIGAVVIEPLQFSEIMECIFYQLLRRHNINSFEADPTEIHSFFHGILNDFSLLQRYLVFSQSEPGSPQLKAAFGQLELSNTIRRKDPWTGEYQISGSLPLVDKFIAALTIDEQAQVEEIADDFAAELGC